MSTILELTIFFGLITLVAFVWKLNKRYDLKKDEMNPVVKRKHQ